MRGGSSIPGSSASKRSSTDVTGEPDLRRRAGDEKLIWTELTPLLELKAAPDAAARLRVILASARDRPGG